LSYERKADSTGLEPDPLAGAQRLAGEPQTFRVYYPCGRQRTRSSRACTLAPLSKRARHFAGLSSMRKEEGLHPKRRVSTLTPVSSRVRPS